MNVHVKNHIFACAGVVIRDPNQDDEEDISAEVKKISLNDKYNDVIWQSCMHHLV